ncbi:hypothetical protein KEM52_006628 [Ascosphaera acerosa]|nr:hypothetical protein KEM52_006628 [Ascosphaera acerosa]
MPSAAAAAAAEHGQSDSSSPRTKRQKTALTTQQSVAVRPSAATGSRIFSPFRTIGLVSPTTVPFTSIPLGKTTFQITTSIGRSLQTYDLKRGLSLVFLTRPQTPGFITATTAWKQYVLAAWDAASTSAALGTTLTGTGGNTRVGVWLYKRGKKATELPMPRDTARIDKLLVFGSWIIGCCGNRIEVWKSATLEHYTTLTPPPATFMTASPQAASDGHVNGDILTGSICSMPTFLNKIFVGRVDGAVDIWNVSTGKLLYTIMPSVPNAGAVTAIQPAPVLGIAAIAYSSGALVLHDVQADEPLITLRSPADNAPPVTTIAFRTDGRGAGDDGREAGVMATAGFESGDVTMWDLNDGGKVTGILRDAHTSASAAASAGVTKIEFLPGQPVLVSTGTDNALCTWIIDESPFSPVPRPLHARKGHAAPVTTLDFLPAASDGSDSLGKWILSASKDRTLWGFSLRKDAQNTEFSQGNVKHKLKKRAAMGPADAAGDELRVSEITCMAASLNRDGGMGAAQKGAVWSNPKVTNAEALAATGWESVVTGHKGDHSARTWLWGSKKAGRWCLPTHDKTEVRSVAVSPCGTFALVGSAGGSIDMYNLQSGIHRQSFPARVTPAQAKKLQMLRASNREQGRQEILLGQGKHTAAVTGIMVDTLNTMVVSCGLDGKVKFWDFLTGKLRHEIDWSAQCSVTGLRFNTGSGDLLFLSCDDLAIRVIDLETKNMVRELWGCVGQINDFCVSRDGRWVIAASMDSVVRVWDLPTGHLIDAFRLPSTCTSLTLSATGEYLATAHADNVGINIWNNRSLFMHVPQTHIDEEDILDVAEPTASGEGGAAMIEAAFEGDDSASEGVAGVNVPVEQLDEQMLTLSLMPKSRWQTLVKLDAIKQRNKPKEPPKAPKAAPFFLSAAAAGKSKDEFAAAAAAGSDIAEPQSRVSRAQLDAQLATQTQFTNLLRSGRQRNDYSPFIEYLKSLSPAKADLEIRSLDPIMRSDERNELADFVAALTQRLETRKDFELVNAWMAVFLKIHADVVGSIGKAEGDEQEDQGSPGRQLLLKRLQQWKVEQQREAARLADMVGNCRGIIGFLRSAR